MEVNEGVRGGVEKELREEGRVKVWSEGKGRG